MRKPRLVALVAAACLGLVLGPAAVLCLAPKPVRINRATYDQISEGMRLEEVEALTGGPPGYYARTSLGSFSIMVAFGSGNSMKPGTQQSWWGDEGLILVGFDDNGTVIWKEFEEVSPVMLGSLPKRVGSSWHHSKSPP
jgi:hypothetical protein